MKQQMLAESAAEFFNIDIDKLKSPCRKDSLTWPRNICIYLANECGTPKSIIGNFWNRDRTIVYNSVKRVDEMLTTSNKRKTQFNNFKEFLKIQIKKKEAGI
jgi:chromosomal replication initiation ATPase DnaA